MILETTEKERKGELVVQCQYIFASFLYLFPLLFVMMKMNVVPS